MMAQAQSIRLRNENTIGWLNTFANIKTGKKTQLHTEYQFRREGPVANWQQSLLRVGVSYAPEKSLQIRAGYAWIETFAYGDTPLNAYGKTFTEHRTFQSLHLNHKSGKLDFSHRYMLEQRWIGTYSNAELDKEDGTLFVNRLRYLARADFPLKGGELTKQTPYVAVYDEVFVGFGENVRENVFDQNRFAVLLGYRFSHQFRAEGGYFNQIIHFGREFDGKNLYQYNNGFIFNMIFTLDVSQ